MDIVKKFLINISNLIFSRVFIFLAIIVAQVAIIAIGVNFLSSYFSSYLAIFDIAGTVILIFIVNKDEPAEFKLTWAVLICMLPVFGSLLYLFNAANWGMVRLKRKVEREHANTIDLLSTSEGTKKAITTQDKAFVNFAHYMENECASPVYHNTNIVYYDIGEKKIEALVEALDKAKKYIFIEYFIISEGRVWDSILEVLKRKAAEGVEVKVMYDGLCSLMKLPYKYPEKLAEYNIEAKMFAPIIPFLSTTQNNRDHRKIVVIDGEVSFTGGVNLADEYANLISIYGHWKDTAVKIEGRASLSFAKLFIQNWNLYGESKLDYSKYLNSETERAHFEHNGFVIPYGDSPTDKYDVGKNVYSSIIASAVNYVYIMMPYFIVDREFLSQIEYAAQRGVEIKLLLPHIPDKKTVFAMTRSFYPDLLDARVKIYEYEPGFLHAKVVVSDDNKATIGSVNFDYRSFYHHFECGVYLYGNHVISEIKEDVNETVKKCIPISLDYYNEINVFERALGRALRLFAPLM